VEGFLGDWFTEKFLSRFGRNLRRLCFISSLGNDETFGSTINLIAKYCPNITRFELITPVALKADYLAVLAPHLRDLLHLEISIPGTLILVFSNGGISDLYSVSSADEIPPSLVTLNHLTHLRVSTDLGMTDMMSDPVVGLRTRTKVDLPSIEKFLDHWRRALPEQLKLNQITLKNDRSILNHFMTSLGVYTKEHFQCSSLSRRSLAARGL
jgi:hypothetical protein